MTNHQMTPAMIAQRDQYLAEFDATSDPVPACPPWCMLRAGHGWEGTEDGRQCREHAGPEFGDFIHITAREYDDGSVVDFGLCVSGDDFEMRACLGPETARRLAADLTLAAEWLEAHREEVPA